MLRFSASGVIFGIFSGRLPGVPCKWRLKKEKCTLPASTYQPSYQSFEKRWGLFFSPNVAIFSSVNVLIHCLGRFIAFSSIALFFLNFLVVQGESLVSGNIKIEYKNSSVSILYEVRSKAESDLFGGIQQRKVFTFR